MGPPAHMPITHSRWQRVRLKALPPPFGSHCPFCGNRFWLLQPALQPVCARQDSLPDRYQADSAVHSQPRAPSSAQAPPHTMRPTGTKPGRCEAKRCKRNSLGHADRARTDRDPLNAFALLTHNQISHVEVLRANNLSYGTMDRALAVSLARTHDMGGSCVRVNTDVRPIPPKYSTATPFPCDWPGAMILTSDWGVQRRGGGGG